MAITPHQTVNGSITSKKAATTDMRYVDIFANNALHRQQIASALKTIHLPGEETGDGFRVYGYALPGQAIDYL